jgi:hypothetical protein
VDQKKRKIIDDLLLKKPMGPKGKTNSSGVIPVVEYFGYNKEVLFDLGLHTQGVIETYVRSRFFEGKDKKALGRQNTTVTRRTKRLWSRLEIPVRKVQQEGGEGIYRIAESKWAYGTPLGYLHAADMQEAQNLANMFFGYLITRSYSPVPYVEIISYEGESELSKYNEEVVKSLKDTIKYTEVSIKDKTKFLNRLSDRIKAVIALQIGQSSFDLDKDTLE